MSFEAVQKALSYKTFADALSLLTEYGQAHHSSALACVNLLIEYFSVIKQEYIEEYIGKKLPTEQLKILSEAYFKDKPLQQLHIEFLHERYFRSNREIYSDAITALYQYKLHLLWIRKHNNFITEKMSASLLLMQLLENERFKSNAVVEELNDMRYAYRDAADQYLKAEHEIDYHQSITIHERISQYKHLLNQRLKLTNEYVNKLIDHGNTKEETVKNEITVENNRTNATFKATLDTALVKICNERPKTPIIPGPDHHAYALYPAYAGLSVLLIATVTLLSLALAPETAHMTAELAASFAAHAQGYIALATTVVLAPSLITCAGTAAVLRFKEKESVQKHNAAAVHEPVHSIL